MIRGLQFFSEPKMSAEEAREFMAAHGAGTFTLLDVRELSEYESAHIPGAVLIPLSELPNRLSELDPEIPLIAY